jgi:hypothetical protein
MMSKVSVPRAEICELLGLDAGVDDATLQRAVDEVLARRKARAAATDLHAADVRLVNAAVAAGKFPASRKQHWLNALSEDRAGATRAIESMVSIPASLRPADDVADPEVEQVHCKVLARLGIKEPARTVAASGAPASGLRSTGPAATGPVDDLGLEISQLPPPVRLVRGKPPEQWTSEERSNWFLHQLGGRFTRGVPKPPGSAGWYLPSPDSPYEAVDKGDGTVEWRAKPDYQSRNWD